MIQDVCIHKLLISKRGERHYFQIKIPRNATRLIGMEMGMFKTTASPYLERVPLEYKPLRVKRNTPYGELRLQSLTAPNFFYSRELLQEDENLVMDDIMVGRSELLFLDPLQPLLLSGRGFSPLGTVYLPSRQYTHGRKMEVDEVDVCPDSLIYGCYTDLIGELESYDHQYAVQIYLWFAAEENEAL